jgi:hypothetical protein
MLIFTHLNKRPEWLAASEPSPFEQIEDEAEDLTPSPYPSGSNGRG